MYVYGPVPSRRLGRSLGVSPIPRKRCSYSCVYCQLGKTRKPSIERESFFPKEDILKEILSKCSTDLPDYVTFVGDGEPTLNKDLGWLISRTKEETGSRIAVITNGSLLYRDDVKSDLANADVVLPSLDAGTARTFITVNRPHKDLNFDKVVQGIADFREMFTGAVWLEVMLVSGFNDTDDEIENIRKYVQLIRPQRVYVLVPIRPPAERWVKPPNRERLLHAKLALTDVHIISDPESGSFDVSSFDNAKSAIIEIGGRHPLRVDEAVEIESEFEEIGIVRKMIEAGELVEAKYDGIEYVLPQIPEIE